MLWLFLEFPTDAFASDSLRSLPVRNLTRKLILISPLDHILSHFESQTIRTPPALIPRIHCQLVRCTSLFVHHVCEDTKPKALLVDQYEDARGPGARFHGISPFKILGSMCPAAGPEFLVEETFAAVLILVAETSWTTGEGDVNRTKITAGRKCSSMHNRRNGTCKEVAIRRSRRRQHHQNGVRRQLETDERTYGSINRENCPTFAGWKRAPATDLSAVLRSQRAYEEMLRQWHHAARRLEEGDGERSSWKGST